MDPNVPGSSNPDPTHGDPFGRNPDGTVTNPQTPPAAPVAPPAEPAAPAAPDPGQGPAHPTAPHQTTDRR